jgi:hypothetical protein
LWIADGDCNHSITVTPSSNDHQITKSPDHKSPLHIPVIDNADDAGIDRRLGGMEREAGLLAANEEDLFADTRANASTATSGRPTG